MIFSAANFPDWLRRLLEWAGHDFSHVPPDAQLEFQWTNMPASWGVFVLIAAVAAVVYAVFRVYRREIDTCPPRVKLLLAALRSGVYLLLVCVFLGPALITLRQRTIQPELILLRDASLSMNTADRYADDAVAGPVAAALGKSVAELRTARPARAAIVNEILARENGQFLAQLSERGRVRALNFSDHVDKVETLSADKPNEGEPGEANQPAAAGKTAGKTVGQPGDPATAAPRLLPPLAPQGRSTDLTQALRESLAGGSPAAILLVSDGQHTGKDDPRQAALEARERGVPILVVGVGDPSRPRNLRVASVYVRPQAWQDEPFEVDAMIVAEGVESRDVRVELIEQRVSESDGSVSAGVSVASQRLSVADKGGRLRCQFSHTAKEPGRYAYAVRVEPLDDELAEDDNQLASPPVKVLSREKVRVLLVAGAPTWDYRLVQKLLARDKTIVLSCWLQTLDEERAQEGTRPITHLPITKEDLFWYDVVLLLDPNPQEFDQAWLDLLKQFAGEHSGGVLFMAGPKHSGQFLSSARTGSLKDVLPVRFGDVGEIELKNLLTTSQRAWPLRIVSSNADHPLMSFFPDRQDNLRRWETLPGIFWSFPSQEAKPTAQVLVEHGDPSLRSVEAARPLLVAGRYGAGHTVYIGFSGTWRWRRAGTQAEFFDKFWIQLVRYLVEGRSLEGRRRGYVQTDRDRYEVGEKITVTARLQDASFAPLAMPRVEATVQAGGDAPQTLFLLPVDKQPGAYEAALTAKQTGLHTLRLPIPGGSADGDAAAIEAPFTVELPSIETSQVWLDKPLLRDLAELSGGKYFEIDQLDALLAAVPDKSEIIEVRDKPMPLWDVQGMLAALVALLAVEWFVRKRCKLL